MFDSLMNTLLVIAGLYVYLSLFRQIAVRHNGAAALGERQLGFPEAIAALLLTGWFVLNVLAAAKVEVFANEENPGYYNARFYLRPHFQLEAMDVGLSLVSRLPAPAAT